MIDLKYFLSLKVIINVTLHKMSDLIIKKLVDNIKETNLDKSSHWQKYLGENSDYLNEFK